MHKLSPRLSVLAFAFAAIAACGGGATPESTTPPPAGSGQPAPGPSASASASASAQATPAPTPAELDAKLEAQRSSFVAKCTATGVGTSNAYCDCGFNQFKEVFKGVDLDKTEPTKEQYEQVKVKTVAACSDKLSEAPIKAGFVTKCSDSDARMNGYCECAWTSLRKTLSVGDMASEPNGPRVDEAKKRMTEECKGKMPEAVLKSAFVSACSKESDAKVCECMWKKVRAKYSAAQIASGAADIKSVPVADCTKK